jgi:hypothetical protein
LKKQGDALKRMKRVGFEHRAVLNGRHAEDLAWLKSKGIDVVAGVELRTPDWLSEY